MTKEFKSVEEIQNDKDFIEKVKLEIDKIVTAHKHRPSPPQGKRYLRTWQDRMIDESILNHEFFIKHIVFIWQKKSTLNSEFRSIIKQVCEYCLWQVINERNKQEGTSS
jgi:hypothetical protein